MLTSPAGGLGLGDFLVLLGSVAWAAQVVLVDRVAGYNPFKVVFYELLPSTLFIAPGLVLEGFPSPSPRALLLLVYLALACTVAAFALQVYGQRFVEPEIAGLVFVLEPVLAAFFSHAVLGETLTPLQLLGAGFTVAGLAVSATAPPPGPADSTGEDTVG